MNRFGLLLMLILCTSLLGSAAHAAWSFNSFYQDVVNVTVSNWNYTQSYIGNPTVLNGIKTNFVLVRIPNTTNIGTFTIQGYTNALGYIGTIRYWPVLSYNGISIILLPSTTTAGISWFQASIFYNSLNQSIGSANKTEQIYQAETNYAGKPIFVSVIASNYIFSTPSPVWSNSLIYNFTAAPTFFNSNNLCFSESCILQNIQNQAPLVVFSTNNLANENFNITSELDYLNNLRINSSAARYKVSSFNPVLFNTFPYVSNGALESKNTNTLFNKFSGFDNIGFEGYFSGTVGSLLLSEAMNASPCYSGLACIISAQLKNSTTTNSYGLFPNYFNTGAITLHIPYNAPPTSIYIMPAFTSNYQIANVAINPNNVILTNATNIWRYAIPITNISWTYNFMTLGTGSNSIPPIWYNFSASNVRYALIKVPHYLGMGQYCQSIMAKVNTSSSFSGYVNFAVVNCTTSNVWIIVHQNTNFGTFFTNFYLLFNNTFGLTSGNGFANSSTFSNWRFQGKSSSFTINTTRMPSNTLPFVVNFTQPIFNVSTYNALQFIGQGTALPFATLTVNNIDGKTKLYALNSAAHVNVFPTALTLYQFTNSSGTSTIMVASSLYWQLICAPPNNAEGLLVLNTTSSIPGVGGTACQRVTGNPIFANLGASVQGLAQYLYTSTSSVGHAYSINNVTTIIPNTSLPNPVSVPTTNSPVSIFTNFNTTINFNSNTLAANIMIFPGYNIQQGYLDVLGIFLFLLASIGLNHKLNADMGIMVMIFMIWVVGIFQSQLLILAVILSVFFIGIEFTRRDKQ